jgi:hypothetical protein
MPKYFEWKLISPWQRLVILLSRMSSSKTRDKPQRLGNGENMQVNTICIIAHTTSVTNTSVTAVLLCFPRVFALIYTYCMLLLRHSGRCSRPHFLTSRDPALPLD